MNGLFAKLTILELRAEVGTCSGSCNSYACFKGGPAEGEGLILVLAGGISLHHWDKLLGWLPRAPVTMHGGPLLPRLSFALLALALPMAADLWLNRCWLYAGLPMLWAVLLARHLPLSMREAGMVLPAGWPHWSADPHVIGFCQTTTVLIGAVGAIILGRRMLEPNRKTWLLGSMMVGLACAGRWLVTF